MEKIQHIKLSLLFTKNKEENGTTAKEKMSSIKMERIAAK